MKVYSSKLKDKQNKIKKEVISFLLLTDLSESAPNVWDLMMIETSGEDPSSFLLTM